MRTFTAPRTLCITLEEFRPHSTFYVVDMYVCDVVYRHEDIKNILKLSSNSAIAFIRLGYVRFPKLNDNIK